MAAAACPLCRKTVLCGPTSSQLTKPPPAFATRAIGWNKARCSKQTYTAQQPRQSSHCLASRACDSDTAQQPLRTGQEAVAPVWDVVGLGQPMVDFSASVDDDLLVRLGIVKGSRRYWVNLLHECRNKSFNSERCCRVISAQQRAEVLQALENTPYQVSAGGSLSNTLIGLSRLGQADNCLRGSGGFQVALAAAVGSDTLGSFFAAQAAKAGVAVLEDSVADSCTGTAIVLTTPDANRTFLSYLGEANDLQLSPAAKQAISTSRIFVVEGYMWEAGNALATISAAADAARRNSAMVVLTAGDAGVVQRHTQEFWQMINAGIDMLFCNKSEAAALLGRPACTAQEAALALGPYCKIALVTDGAHGSYISAMGQLYSIPPCWTSHTPVDTCGAGDGYAAGAMYGFLCGYDLTNIGRAGARVASAVILRQGATTTEDEAVNLVQDLPETTNDHQTSCIGLPGVSQLQKQTQYL